MCGQPPKATHLDVRVGRCISRPNGRLSGPCGFCRRLTLNTYEYELAHAHAAPGRRYEKAGNDNQRNLASQVSAHQHPASAECLVNRRLVDTLGSTETVEGISD